MTRTSSQVRTVLPDLWGQRGHQVSSTPGESRAAEEDPFFRGHSKLYNRRKEIEAELRRELHIPQDDYEDDGGPLSPGMARRGTVQFGRPPPVPRPRATRSRLPPIPKVAPEPVHGRWGNVDRSPSPHPSSSSGATGQEQPGEGDRRWWKAEQEALHARSEARVPANAEAVPGNDCPEEHTAGSPVEESPVKARNRPQSWRVPRQMSTEVVREDVQQQQEKPWNAMAKELEEMARQSRKRAEERQQELKEAERRAAEAEAERAEREAQERKRHLEEEQARERRAREQKRFEEQQRREIRRLQKETEEARKRRKEQEEWEAEVRNKFKEEARLREEAQQREHHNLDQKEHDMQAELRRQQEARERRRQEAQQREARQRTEGAGDQHSSPEKGSGARPSSSTRAGHRTGKHEESPNRMRASSVPSSKLRASQELDQARAAAMRQLSALRQLPDKEARQKGFKDLLRAWHPDKNPSNVEVATAVFQLIQAERPRVLKP